MFDSFDVGFDICKPQFFDVNALILKNKSKTRSYFSITSEERQLGALLGKPPKKNETYKILSFKGGVSSIGFISFVANLEKIEELYVSTFRVGKKQFNIICNLIDCGKIDHATVITSDFQAIAENEKYDYFDYEQGKADEYGITFKTAHNHSKIICMKTTNNFYVIETSSNLNENPKIEQFSLENDSKLYAFYREFMEAI